MKRLNSLALLAAGIAAGAAGGYWYAHRNEPMTMPAVVEQTADNEHAGHNEHAGQNGHTDHNGHAGHGDTQDTAAEADESDREILYYRNPMGEPDTSPVPKKDSMGMDYIPVYADEAGKEKNDANGHHEMDHGDTGQNATGHDRHDHGSEHDEDKKSRESDKSDESGKSGESGDGEREILYYRNPMGLPDTSPVPKKDSMGMDYIPVYADEVDDSGTVKVSLAKVQRSGVRTETVKPKALSRTVRGVGTVEHDESTLSVVTVRSDGYVEELFVDKTGQHIEAGEPMFRFYSPQIQLAQVDLLVSLRAEGRPGAARELQGAIQKLRNLDVPQTRIDEVMKTEENPRTLDWPAPATGHVMTKNVIKGQFVEAGDELFRIADNEHVWVVAEIAEADIADIEVGTPVTVTLRAFPNAPREGKVTFIYPHMMKPEMRTVSVRIELPNPDGDMRPGMYADVVFHPGTGDPKVMAIPADAVIDSGARKVVFVAKGEGRFEPREVELGRRGEDSVEVLEGLAEGEEVVTSATFLIDSESNLKAALESFTQETAQ
ncbi:MAG: efflux RND transporter periplasmic adaptor subunit [Methyloligella sp. ZOD6]